MESSKSEQISTIKARLKMTRSEQTDHEKTFPKLKVVMNVNIEYSDFSTVLAED